jgi:hypothetical protein
MTARATLGERGTAALPELRAEALDYLVAVIRSKPKGRQLQAGVAAARAFLEATKTESPSRGNAFDQLSTPELEALAAKATAALGETVQ